jgi:hypothetical protein
LRQLQGDYARNAFEWENSRFIASLELAAWNSALSRSAAPFRRGSGLGLGLAAADAGAAAVRDAADGSDELRTGVAFMNRWCSACASSGLRSAAAAAPELEPAAAGDASDSAESVCAVAEAGDCRR